MRGEGAVVGEPTNGEAAAADDGANETGPADCDEQDFLRHDPNEVTAERLRGDPNTSAEA